MLAVVQQLSRAFAFPDQLQKQLPTPFPVNFHGEPISFALGSFVRRQSMQISMTVQLCSLRNFKHFDAIDAIRLQMNTEPFVSCLTLWK